MLFFSIWLARNNRIFSGEITDDSTLVKLIKARAWHWSSANELTTVKWADLWCINPRQAYKSSRIDGLQSIFSRWFRVYDFIGCIDGAWKQDQDGNIKAGIGGFILDRKAQVTFIFSGPCTSSNPFQTEESALEFMINSIIQKGLKDISLLIASDSSQLIKSCRLNTSSLLEVSTLVQSIRVLPNLKVAHLNRRFNSEADRLAKEGMLRSAIIAGWV